MSNFLDNFTEEESIAKTAKGIKTVDYEVENDDEYSKNKKRRIIIEIVVFAFIVTIGVFSLLYFSKVEVPNFNNHLSSIAEKWGSTNNVQIIVTENYNDEIESGYIISQSIKEGTRISKKSILEVEVSKGYNPNEVISFPDLKSMTGADIKTWVDDNNLINTIITEENSKKIDKGQLINYSFSSAIVNENNFKRSDSLEIIISKGDVEEVKNIEVVNLVSKTKEDATKWCTDNGLICKFTEVISDEYESGKVVSQSIKSGETVSKGSELTLRVSAGKGIIIPNYTDVNSEDAAAIDAKISLTIKRIYSVTVGYGKLISQSVKADTRRLESNNKVELLYSLGNPYFTSLAGKSENELAKIFYDYNQKGVNFTYTIKYVNSSEEKGTIISSSKSNEFVTMTESIEIRVSNGVVSG